MSSRTANAAASRYDRTQWFTSAGGEYCSSTSRAAAAAAVSGTGISVRRTPPVSAIHSLGRMGSVTQTRPELTGDFGMVASTHWLASAVGMAMLERGGNAFDAAVSAGFTLQVVEPHLNGPGGEVPMLVRRAGSDDVDVIAGQGPAPVGATVDHFASLGLELVPGTGHLAACVPGAFDAWLTLLEQYGTRTLPEVFAPAIGYARRGYPVLPSIARTIGLVHQLFSEHWPTSAAVYLPGGT